MITYSKSFKEFLGTSNNKVAEILWKAHCGLHAWRFAVTNEEIDYITFRHDGTISYLPAGKPHQENDEGDWKRDGRQNGKPGKVIRKLFSANGLKLIPAKEFEKFANQYKAEYNGGDYTFEVKKNKLIPEVYEMDRVCGGTLGDSCMNGDVGYLDMYANCKQLSILILKNKDGKLCGRALIWQVSEDLTILDRIYVCSDFMCNMFIDYAEEKGWYHKKHFSTYDYKTTFISPDGKEVEKYITIKTRTDFDEYPYIDTMTYGGNGYLKNTQDGTCYEYTETDGTRCDGEEEEDDHYGESYDDITERWIDEDDAVVLSNSGDRQYRSLTTHQDYAIQTIDGNWFCEHDSHIIEVNDRWYEKDDDRIRYVDDDWHLASDVVYSEYHGEDLLKDDCVKSDILNDWIKEDDAVEVDGEWYPKDHDDITEVNGTYVLVSSLEPEEN